MRPPIPWRLLLTGILVFAILSVAGVFLYYYATSADPTKAARESVARQKAEEEKNKKPEADSLVPGDGKKQIASKPALDAPMDTGAPTEKVSVGTRGEITAVMPGDVAAEKEKTLALERAPKPPISLPTTPSPTGIVPQENFEEEAGAVVPVPTQLVQQPGQVSRRRVEAEPSRQRVVVGGRYLFNNLGAGVLGVQPIVLKGSGAGDFNIDTFAPIGEDIEAVLMENVATNNFEVSVVAGVWFDFVYQGNRLLNTGTKLLGTAAAGKSRDRVLASFDKIILKNGQSIAFRGIAINTDGTVGIPGFQVGNVLLQSLVPILIEAAAGTASQLQSRTNSTSSNFFGGTTTTTTTDNSLSNAGLGAVSRTLDKIAELIVNEIEENRPYILAPAGTRFKIRLLGPLDTSVAEYGQ